jgi:hypothetical protein
MVFQYKVVVVSGLPEGLEGASEALREISTFMQDAGWTLEDDRSAEPGTAISATHMKYVFSSTGESNQYPRFYTTLFSGTAASVNSNSITMMVHSAYDVGAHDVPASGVKSALLELPTANQPFQVRSQDDNTELTMSGDSEMVHIITARVNSNNLTTTMSNGYVGRFNSFLSVEDNPFPLVQVATNFNTIRTVATFRDLTGIGGNPPIAFDQLSSMIVFIPSALNDAHGPYNVGTATSIFFAQPMFISYNSTLTTPPAKGIAGTVRGAWSGNDGTSMLNKTILTASGAGFGVQEYQAFRPEANNTTVPSIIIRKS